MKEELHQKAMAFAEEAFLAQQRKDWEAVQRLSQLAYQYEIQAVSMFERSTTNEPVRSILYKSAAALALQANMLTEAEKAVCEGLLGFPPHDIAIELREILDQLNFERHLIVKEYELSHEEFQISLQGPETGSGIIATELFTSRMSALEKIAWRTTERKLNRPFRKGGAPAFSIQEKCDLYLAATRPNCFAAIIKIALHQQLPGISLAQDIVKDIVSCFDSFVNDDEDGLKEIIPDQEYFQNFVGLATQLAPDGKRLSFVGISANINGHEKKVRITKPGREHAISKKTSAPQEFQTPSEAVTFRGILGFADSFDSKSIKIQLDNGTKIKIRVPIALMEDVVRPYYNQTVEIECVKDNNNYVLINIASA